MILLLVATLLLTSSDYSLTKASTDNDNEDFEDQNLMNIPGLNYTVSAPAPQNAETSDSRSFAASGVVLLYRNPTPFTVSYSLDGELVDPQPLP
jgi:hypothetical protein